MADSQWPSLVIQAYNSKLCDYQDSRTYNARVRQWRAENPNAQPSVLAPVWREVTQEEFVRLAEEIKCQNPCHYQDVEKYSAVTTGKDLTQEEFESLHRSKCNRAVDEGQVVCKFTNLEAYNMLRFSQGRRPVTLGEFQALQEQWKCGKKPSTELPPDELPSDGTSRGPRTGRFTGQDTVTSDVEERQARIDAARRAAIAQATADRQACIDAGSLWENGRCVQKLPDDKKPDTSFFQRHKTSIIIGVAAGGALILWSVMKKPTKKSKRRRSR